MSNKTNQAAVKGIHNRLHGQVEKEQLLIVSCYLKKMAESNKIER